VDAVEAGSAAADGSLRRAGYRRSAGTPRGEARRRELLDRVVDDLAVNGLVTRRGDAATARWIRPVLTQSGIRRDTVKVLRAAAADSGVMLAAAERLPGFGQPVLVVWARGDRVMPPEHGRRLAKQLPQGQLAEVDDSYTLIPLDQPARLAQLIREFTLASVAS
jgi:pimeloyl-ACP methyl ester carboxylesterase